MRRTRKGATWSDGALLGALLALAACGKEPAPEPAEARAPESPRTARAEVRDQLLADLALARSPSDGQGRAWLEPLDGRPLDVVAGGSGAWRIVFEAGEPGVARGGAIFLQASPFWGWSTPQVTAPDAPGFTRVETSASGVELEARTADRGLLEVKIAGRALARGERVTLDFGAGPLGARADDYAEQRSPLWIAVDGDGDGVREPIAEPPCIDVIAGPAALLSAVAPTVLRPGERGTLRFALLDAGGNAGVRESAVLRLEDAPEWIGDATLELAPASGGLATSSFIAGGEGTYRFRAVAVTSDGRELVRELGPLCVSATGPRVLWADLHGHSGESDGTGTVEAYWSYARDVAGLDAAALTDHDHWGMRFLDRRKADWDAFAEYARAQSRPDFVAIPGYEYTDWIHGHRCVLYFGETAELFSSLDERTDTPAKLWNALRGKKALTIPHHVGGGPIALDWSVPSDPELEPVVEIVSVHGSSEAEDSPNRIGDPVPGCFARDGLARGAPLGFIGSGDTHDGHPGLARLGGHYGCSGLAAIVSEERSASAIHDALKARRVYATSGARILLRFSFAGAPMGSVVSAAEAARSAALFASVVGTAPIARIDVVRGASVAVSFEGDGAPELAISGVLDWVGPGEWVYVRVVQADGELAWSSPIFVR